MRGDAADGRDSKDSVRVMLAFQRHRQFATDDAACANRYLREAYCPHSMQPHLAGQSLAFRYWELPVGPAAFSYVHYGPAVDITPRRFGTFCLLSMPIGGDVDATINGERQRISAHQPVLFNADDALALHWPPGVGALILRFDLDYLEHRAGCSAAAPAGERRVRFISCLPRHAPAARRLSTRILDLQSGLATAAGRLRRNPAAATAQVAAIADHLLAHYRPARESAAADRAGGLPLSVRHALWLIGQQAEDIQSVADLVARCGVSARALQLGFQKAFGRGPLALLRDARLARVRTYLLEGVQPATVTAAAMHGGWYQLDRLGAAYRRRYGELPRETLARAAARGG